MIDTCIDLLLRYEKYIPVLTDEEQIRLLDQQPTLVQLQDWEKRLQSRSAETDDRFKQAYSKIKQGKSKWTKTM